MSTLTPDPAPRSWLAQVLGPRTIRGRLARILLVSLLLVFGLTADIITGVAERYFDSVDTLDSLIVSTRITDLDHEAALERGLTNAYLYGDGRFLDMMLAQRVKTDQALHSMNAALSKYDVPDIGEARSAVAKLAGLSAIRESVDSHHFDRSAVYQFFTDALNGFQRVSFIDQVNDNDLRTALQAGYVLNYVRENLASERDLLVGVFVSGRVGVEENSGLQVILAGETAVYAAFEAEDKEGKYRSSFEAALKSPEAAQAHTALRVAADSGTGPLTHSVDPMALWSQTNFVIGALAKCGR